MVVWVEAPAQGFWFAVSVWQAFLLPREGGKMAGCGWDASKASCIAALQHSAQLSSIGELSSARLSSAQQAHGAQALQCW